MPELFSSWGFWYVVGVAIVAIAATVVIAILLVARGIEKEATRALAAGARVKMNTDPLFELGGALEGLETVREVAGRVEAKAGHLARAVHQEAAGAGSPGGGRP